MKPFVQNNPKLPFLFDDDVDDCAPPESLFPETASGRFRTFDITPTDPVAITLCIERYFSRVPLWERFSATLRLQDRKSQSLVTHTCERDASRTAFVVLVSLAGMDDFAPIFQIILC